MRCPDRAGKRVRFIVERGADVKVDLLLEIGFLGRENQGENKQNKQSKVLHRNGIGDRGKVF